ncbi:MAG: hypothetical protein ABI158_11505 [Edaphobacter sp.]
MDAAAPASVMVAGANRQVALAGRPEQVKLILVTAIGCSSSSSGSNTPPTPVTPKGTSTVSVSATASGGISSVSHPVSITLTIN